MATDKNGRPVYPQPPDVTERVAEKAEALDAKLRLIERQEAAQLAAFTSGPKPKRSGKG